MPFDTFSRRSFLQGAAAGTAAAALGFPSLAQAQSGVTIGVVYV
ncbi:MAG: twin-arginine translocation signal domain-containing protein, partial [Methylobacterium sp.]